MPKGIGGFIDKIFIDKRFKKKKVEEGKVMLLKTKFNESFWWFKSY